MTLQVPADDHIAGTVSRLGQTSLLVDIHGGAGDANAAFGWHVNDQAARPAHIDALQNRQRRRHFDGIEPVSKALIENEDAILEELTAAQGDAVDIGGYYRPDDELASAAMRPSATLNGILDSV